MRDGQVDTVADTIEEGDLEAEGLVFADLAGEAEDVTEREQRAELPGAEGTQGEGPEPVRG